MRPLGEVYAPNEWNVAGTSGSPEVKMLPIIIASLIVFIGLVVIMFRSGFLSLFPFFHKKWWDLVKIVSVQWELLQTQLGFVGIGLFVYLGFGEATSLLLEAHKMPTITWHTSCFPFLKILHCDPLQYFCWYRLLALAYLIRDLIKEFSKIPQIQCSHDLIFRGKKMDSQA